MLGVGSGPVAGRLWPEAKLAEILRRAIEISRRDVSLELYGQRVGFK